MAHSGPAAKANKHGRTPTADWIDVPDVPYGGPWPDLPKLRGGGKWNELALEWWNEVRVMPHCVLWEKTDWLYATHTALMMHYWFRDMASGEATTSQATEIRRREDHIGTTLESRRKLRIRYVEPERAGVQTAVGQGAEQPDDGPAQVIEQDGTAGPGTVTALESRRSRLTRKPA